MRGKSRSNGANMIKIYFIYAWSLKSVVCFPEVARKVHRRPHHLLSSIKWQLVHSGPAVDPSKAIHEVQKSWCIQLEFSLNSSSYSWSWGSEQLRLELLSAASLGLRTLAPSFSLHLPHSFTQPWSPAIPPSQFLRGSSFKPLLVKDLLIQPRLLYIPHSGGRTFLEHETLCYVHA